MDKKDNKALAIISLILGIVAFLSGIILIGIIPAIGSVITGVIYLINIRKKKNNGKLKGIAITGICLSSLSMVAFIFMVGLMVNIDKTTKEIELYMNNEQYDEALNVLNNSTLSDVDLYYQVYVGAKKYDDAAEYVMNWNDINLVKNGPKYIEMLDKIYNQCDFDTKQKIDDYKVSINNAIEENENKKIELAKQKEEKQLEKIQKKEQEAISKEQEKERKKNEKSKEKQLDEKEKELVAKEKELTEKEKQLEEKENELKVIEEQGSGTDNVIATCTPTVSPTNVPTIRPTSTPSAKPTSTPSAKPTSTPSVKPTFTPTDENIYFKDKVLNSNFIQAAKVSNIDLGKIGTIERKNDWANGPRYTLKYGDDTLYLYAYENGVISSISLNSPTENKIYEENVFENGAKNGDGDIIELVDGVLGDYGKEDDFDGTKMIRYYVPIGKYNVTTERKGSGLFIESIKTHKENGFDTTDTYDYITFGSADETYEIEIEEGQCILLIINSKVELVKKN